MCLFFYNCYTELAKVQVGMYASIRSAIPELLKVGAVVVVVPTLCFSERSAGLAGPLATYYLHTYVVQHAPIFPKIFMEMAFV